jgi:hypothetical protein
MTRPWEQGKPATDPAALTGFNISLLGCGIVVAGLCWLLVALAS